MPAVVYADNIVDQAKVEKTVKQLESALDKKFASELSVDDKNRVKRNILNKGALDYKAHNYNSSIYVLSGENRSIQFSLPTTSNTSYSCVLIALSISAITACNCSFAVSKSANCVVKKS